MTTDKEPYELLEAVERAIFKGRMAMVHHDRCPSKNAEYDTKIKTLLADIERLKTDNMKLNTINTALQTMQPNTKILICDACDGYGGHDPDPDGYGGGCCSECGGMAYIIESKYGITK